MFELIISSVRTGRVIRKLFDRREEAGRHADKFMDNPGGLRPRNPRDYRVEVVYRDAPEVVARLSNNRHLSVVPAA